jgi:hypothetical protein
VNSFRPRWTSVQFAHMPARTYGSAKRSPG